VFHTTRWSVVRRAGRDDPEARVALEELCRQYWTPVRTYVGRFWGDGAEADDLTQAFFADLLERESWRGVDPEKGRFRSWLRACARNYLLNQRRRRRPEDAGDDVPEPEDPAEPVHEFERAWAHTLLATVMGKLRARYAAEGRGPLFATLRPALAGGETSGAELGAALGLSEGAARVALHRLRQRFGETLRAEVRQTLEDPGQVEEEIRDLFRVLGRPREVHEDSP